MSSSSRPAIFSRLLFLLGVVAAVWFAYRFVRVALAPVSVPPVPPQRGAVRFDPRLDVSKHTIFPRLRPLGPLEVEPGVRGRVNPFIATPPVATSTQTTRSSETSVSGQAAASTGTGSPP